MAQNVAIVSAGEESDRAAEGMAKEATAACGYGVKVIPKRAPITVDYSSSSEAATGTTPSDIQMQLAADAPDPRPPRGAGWLTPARGA